jgi:5-oxopent-3-ene-1,2,5-tricarboxylate decarboxylase/2-hydroxyhepta-2,4-diene-1,7-dioate isomerase
MPMNSPSTGAPQVAFPFAPFRLSGVVYGVLLNDPASLAALGDAVHGLPYKAPPRAPVLYLKPRNTLAGDGSTLHVPAGFDGVEIGAALGMVIGRTACRVEEADALAHVAGYVAVNDACLPHDSYYRPSLRWRARDGFCPMATTVAHASAVPDPDAVDMRVTVDGVAVHVTSTRGRVRGAARLLADVTAFMTLQPGDVLLLGASHGAPTARAGQAVRVEIDGVGHVDSRVAFEEGTP